MNENIQRSFGPPEAQIQSNGIDVEIVNFIPHETHVDQCLSHHMLVSWLYPRPVMGQIRLTTSGASPRLSDFGALAFIPASLRTLTRYKWGNEPRRAIVIRFAPEIFNHLFRDNVGLFDPCSMTNYNINAPEVRHATQILAKEALSPDFASTIMLESVGNALLVQLARHIRQIPRGSVSATKGGLAPWQLRRINERIIEDNNTLPPSLTELAALVGISAGHLQRAFKQSTGRTIGDHVRNARIERAQSLLSDTDLTLKEISIQLGFTAQSGFTSAFQRGTGESPSTFRRRTCSGRSLIALPALYPRCN